MNAEIIITDARDWWFIDHLALLVKQNGLVYHLTNHPTNELGGNVFIENENDFLSDRVLVDRYPVQVDPYCVDQFAQKNLTRKYNVFTFNCEHFVSELITGKQDSPQLKKWLWRAGLTGAVVYGVHRQMRN